MAWRLTDHKPLPELMRMKFYNAIWRHQAVMIWYNQSIRNQSQEQISQKLPLLITTFLNRRIIFKLTTAKQFITKREHVRISSPDYIVNTTCYCCCRICCWIWIRLLSSCHQFRITFFSHFELGQLIVRCGFDQPGVGITNTIPPVLLFFAFYFSIIKTHVSYWIWPWYLTGVAAAQRWHLSNINVI